MITGAKIRDIIENSKLFFVFFMHKQFFRRKTLSRTAHKRGTREIERTYLVCHLGFKFLGLVDHLLNLAY